MASKFAEIYVLLGLKKKGFDKGVKSTKSNLMDMGKSFAMTTAAIAGTGLAIYAAGKQIYAVGKRGAIVTQTAESFEYLSEKIGLAPDILEQLRKASLNTIDDMKLMSSTATLLAGTSDELGKALGDNVPQLMRIAKAANKLNPSLGTTSFMYESIALGIKRASPMILDNLGITVKLGEANDAMAKSLGKSVDALSAEEKQLALLNSVLGESGERLLNQVDGLDSATDSFAQMETKISNLKDTLAQEFSPAISDAVDWIAKMTEGIIQYTHNENMLNAAWEEGIITQAEHSKMMRKLMLGLIDTAELTRYLEQKIRNWRVEMGLADHQLVELEGHERAYIEASDDAVEVTEEMISVTDDWTSAMVGAKGALEGLEDVLANQYKKALDAATDSVYELERMKLVLKLTTEELTKSEIEHSLNMLDSIDRVETLTQAVDDGEVAQRDFRLALADGIVTQNEYNDMMGIVADKTSWVGDAMASTRDRAKELEHQLDVMTQRKYDLYFKIHVQGKIPNVPGKGERAIPLQHGASFTVPGGFPNDSFFFPMALSSGEHVEVTPRGRRGRGGNTYIYNRGGDRVNIENTAQAAFLIEKQRQAEFDQIDRVI